MWFNVAYFSTWRPHENRVSKTRFTTLINTEPITYQRKPREEKKKKKKPEERRTKKPRQRAAWVARCLGFFHPGACHPGRTWPGPGLRVTWATHCQGFFHPGRTWPMPRWWGEHLIVFLVKWALDSFSLSLIFWSDWIFFFWYFSLYMGDLKLKFFWFKNRVLETRFSSGRHVEKDATSEVISPRKSSHWDSIYRLKSSFLNSRY